MIIKRIRILYYLQEVAMGLRFIFGPAGSGKTNTCCNEIKDYLMQSPEHQAIFLVPDQGTYRAESMLAAHMPAHGFTRASVSGFPGLATVYFRKCIPA